MCTPSSAVSRYSCGIYSTELSSCCQSPGILPNLLPLSGNCAFPDITLSRKSKRPALPFVLLIRRPDIPPLRADRPALRHQLARHSCFYAADDECDRLGAANQHELIVSSLLHSLFAVFVSRVTCSLSLHYL